MLTRSLVVFFSLALLTACDMATTSTSTPERTALNPFATRETTRKALYPLSLAAPLPSRGLDPFIWLNWEGDTPPSSLTTQKWTEFNDFRADWEADYALPRSESWDAFERALKLAYPLSLVVYAFPVGTCPGDCQQLVIIEGRASWVSSGFLGSVKR